MLDIVCATPTLKEGVNTPTSKVVIVGTTYFDEETERQQPLGAHDFVNLAGRAGRPGLETEGMVILVPRQLAPTEAIQEGQRLLLMPEDALRIRGTLERIQRELQELSPEDIDSVSPDVQALLLGLEATGYNDVPAYRRFFARTLSSYQNESDIDSICQNTLVLMERMRENAGADFLRFFHRLGYRFAHAARFILPLLTTRKGGIPVNRFPRNGNEISPVLLEPLMQSIIQVPELQGRVFRATPREVPDAQIVADWMNGCSYSEIAQTYFRSKSAGKALGFAVRYLSDASTWLSWGFGACYLLIQTMFQGDCDEELGCLPLYMRFGVQQPVAAFCSLLGVTDRHVANQLAEIYPARLKGGLPDFQRLRNGWGSFQAKNLSDYQKAENFVLNLSSVISGKDG